jgi:AraC-like DNA-binding protein
MSDPLVDPSRLASTAAPMLFAVRRDQGDVRRTGWHRHRQGQLLGTIRGVVTIGAGRGRWLIPPVNAAWLPPHSEHDLTSHGAFYGWSVYVAETACEGLPKAPRVIRVSALLKEAVARAASWPEEPLRGAQNNVARVILDEIAAASEEALGLPMPADPRLQQIARALADDPAARGGMAAWAAWAGVAPRTLSRRFTQETGWTFSAWRRRALLLRSLEMLAAGASVTAVALDLGYDTVSAFIELFRSHFGTTPGRYFRDWQRPDSTKDR